MNRWYTRWWLAHIRKVEVWWGYDLRDWRIGGYWRLDTGGCQAGPLWLEVHEYLDL